MTPPNTAAAPQAPQPPTCPSRDLIQRFLRSYYRDLEARTATWRDVSKRMQHDLAPFTTLKLGGFSLGNIAPKLLGHVLSHTPPVTNLQTVDLGFNRISDKGAALLATALTHNTSLLSLYLSGNDIGPTGAARLAHALTLNTTLASLHLSGNNMGEAGAASLADGLKRNAGLRALYVGTNGIGSTGAAAFADALTCNRTLQELTLGQNRIGSDGVAHLATAFATGETILTTLEIGKNSVDAAGALALAKALCAAPNALQNLYMDNNPLGDAGASAIGALLAKNTMLRVLDISYTQLSLLGLRDVSVGLAYSRALVCLMLDGHDWASTQFMLKANAAGAALSAHGASTYAANCIVSAMHANPHSALVKLTGVDLSVVVPTIIPSTVVASADEAAAAAATRQTASATATATCGASNTNTNTNNINNNNTRRSSDTLSRNERVLQFLRAERQTAAARADADAMTDARSASSTATSGSSSATTTNKRKMDEATTDAGDARNRDATKVCDDDDDAATERTSPPTMPKYQRLDANGPVKSSSSSGICSSPTERRRTDRVSTTTTTTTTTAAAAGVASTPPTYPSKRPPRVGLPSRGSLVQLSSAVSTDGNNNSSSTVPTRVSLSSPQSEIEIRKVVADIALLPFSADESANLQAYYLGGGCHSPKALTLPPATAATPPDSARSPTLCPACRTSRLATMPRVMALKSRFESQHDASPGATAAALLVLLRQVHYLTGVFQHVDNADERIDTLLASMYATPPPIAASVALPKGSSVPPRHTGPRSSSVSNATLPPPSGR